jgi:hypothetical protein
MKTPKIAAGKTISSSGFIAPRVAEGNCNYKGKETHNHMFKVVNDPKSSVTAADRIDQSEITVYCSI